MRNFFAVLIGLLVGTLAALLISAYGAERDSGVSDRCYSQSCAHHWQHAGRWR
jgi:hypothetical protein